MGSNRGFDPPRLVTAYIEITPQDVIKYELDKTSVLQRVDRVLQTSSSPRHSVASSPGPIAVPTLRRRSASVTETDGDPLDICVFSERPID